MRASLLLALLLLPGCSVKSPIPPAPGDTSGYFPLEVRSTERMGGSVWIDLQEEAHVAVFTLREEEGAVLLWPFSEEAPQTMPAGSTMVPERTSEEERIARWRESYLFPAPQRSPRSARQQTLVLVVASSQPLPLERYFADHQALRRDLGGDFIDVTRATSGIIDLMVENQQGYNWAWACAGTPMWCKGG